MTIPIDVEVGASALGAAEVTIATLAAFAPKIDVYVDATADPLLLDSVWTVYAVPGAGGTATPLASATLRNIGAGLRLLAGVDGAGDTVVLKARSVRGVTAAVTAALIGWDPNAQTTNVTDKLSAVLGGGVASGVVNQVVATGLAWHPSVDAFVSIAPASVAGSRWAIRAVIAGFSAPVEVGQAIYVGGGNQKIVSVEGGASSWEIVVSTPQGAIGASAASIVGRSRAGAVPVAAGGLSLVGAYAQRTAIAGAAPVTGTRYGNTDRFGGVAIWTGAAWQPELTPGILGTAPPPANDAGWVDINWSGAGATSLVQQGDAIFLSDFGGFAAAENVRGVVRALPAPPWTVEVAFLPTIIQANNSMAIGLLLRESGSGKMKRFAAFSAAGITPRIAEEVWPRANAVGLVRAGLGATFTTPSEAQRLPPEIVLRRLRGPAPESRLMLGWRQPPDPEPALAAFLRVAGA